MNAKKHTSISLHGLRLLFPPLATLGILFLTEWIARGSLTGETFTQYIFPHAEAYLLAWAMLFLSWLAVDWLTRFAPLATLLAAVLGCERPTTIEEKKRLALTHRIALWDTIASCEIEGSSDSSIRGVVPNDLSPILRGADIRQIYCNGGTSYQYFRRYQQQLTGREAVKLPSTSPANAAWSAERLTAAWRVILEALK